MRTRDNVVDIKHQLNNNLQKQPLSVYFYSMLIQNNCDKKKKHCQDK